jgi:ribose transport system substrate-binding protein
MKFDWGTFKLADRIATKLQKGQQLNLVVSIEGTGIPIFGAAMKNGWDRGVKSVGDKYGKPVTGRVIGPINTDVAAQVAEIDSLLSAGSIDCLSFEAHEPGPYVDVINKAITQGVPVFGVNADSADSKRFAFYAGDEFAGGKQAGQATGQWAKTNNINLKKAALMTGSVEGPWAQNRMKGFVEGIKAVLPDIQFINTTTTGIESQGFDQAAVYAKAGAYIAGHPDVDIIFHTDQGVEMVAKVIKDRNLVGKKWTSGYNISAQTAGFIKDGVIVVTMVQGFSNQSEAGAKACGNFLLGGQYDTGGADATTRPHVIIPQVPVTKDTVSQKDWTDPANL